MYLSGLKIYIAYLNSSSCGTLTGPWLIRQSPGRRLMSGLFYKETSSCEWQEELRGVFQVEILVTEPMFKNIWNIQQIFSEPLGMDLISYFRALGSRSQ